MSNYINANFFNAILANMAPPPPPPPDDSSFPCCDTVKAVIAIALEIFSILVTFVFYDAPNWICQTISKLFTFDSGFPEPLAEPAPTEEIIVARQDAALARFEQIKNGNIEFEINPAVKNFNLDGALSRFDSDNHRGLNVHFNYAIEDRHRVYQYRDQHGNLVTRDVDQAFQTILRKYDYSNNPQDQISKGYLSNLGDILSQKKARIGNDPRKEALLKKEIEYYILRLIDAHENCPDQILGAIQPIMVDAVAGLSTLGNVEIIRGEEGAQGAMQYTQAQLQWQAAAALYKLRLDLVKEIVREQNPGYCHMADLERSVVRDFIDDFGLHSKVNEILPYLPQPTHEIGPKVVRAFNRRYYNKNSNDQRPLSYLKNNLAVYFGTTQTLRGSLLSWAWNQYDFTRADDKTVDLYNKLSEDKNNPAWEGGNLSDAGLLIIMEASGLIRQKA